MNVKEKNMRFKKALIGLCAGGVVLGFGMGQTTWAQTEAEGKTKTTEEKVKAESLIELAPIVVNTNRRYYKFYGQPDETIQGGILERSQLTGSWNGGRDKLIDAGIYFDIGLTQNFVGNVSGGTDSGGSQYSGSLDFWLNLDTTKLTNALWPGATIFLHGEKRWNDGIYADVGAAIPPVFDDTMPDPSSDSRFYLSEYYLVQALSPKLSVWAGQMNGAGLVDGNAFANSEKHQFMNTALVDNPAIGAFAPYTAFTAAAIYLPNTENVFIAAVMDADGAVDESVFDTYSTDETVFVASYGWLPEFDGKPGRYQLLGAYTNKDYPDLAFDSRIKTLFEEETGVLVENDKSDNYILLGTFDQYLYVKDMKRLIGWGLFARFAFDPKDRNAIDQFYSLGVGGRGCLIPGRDLDFWGLGWAGTHLSSDLREDLKFDGINIDSMEHVIEGFYNIALTPAIYLTLDAQYIMNPVVAQVKQDKGFDVDSDDHAWVIGSRLQIDF